MRILFILLLMLAGSPLHGEDLSVGGENSAGGEPRVDVYKKDGIFHVSLDAHIDAPAQSVRDVVVDYSRFSQLNPDIVEIMVLNSPRPNVDRVHSIIRGCVMAFCRDMVQVQDVELLTNGDIVVNTLPEESDFRVGKIHWRIRSEGEGTRIQFIAQMAPSFWVPPLLGSWAIKGKLKQDTLMTVRRLSSLLRQDMASALAVN